MESYMHRGIKPHVWGLEKTIVSGPHYTQKILTVYPNNKASETIFHSKNKHTVHVLQGFWHLEVYGCVTEELSLNPEDWGKMFDYVMSQGQSLEIDPLHAFRFWSWQEVSVVSVVSQVDNDNRIEKIQESCDAPKR